MSEIRSHGAGRWVVKDLIPNSMKMKVSLYQEKEDIAPEDLPLVISMWDIWDLKEEYIEEWDMKTKRWIRLDETNPED